METEAVLGPGLDAQVGEGEAGAEGRRPPRPGRGLGRQWRRLLRRGGPWGEVDVATEGCDGPAPVCCRGPQGTPRGLVTGETQPRPLSTHVSHSLTWSLSSFEISLGHSSGLRSMKP